MTGSSTATARTVVDELVRGGTLHAVLSPGSRSAPLAIALYDADAAGRLTLHVRIDERSAAFLALGIAKTSGRPVPVVTTSGTAVANVHPAVLEAQHAGVPLVAVTADRPATMRGTGANQATDQHGIFGAAPRYFADLPTNVDSSASRAVVARAVAAARGTLSAAPGPAHLNVQFSEPLIPGSDEPPVTGGRSGDAPWTTADGSSTVAHGNPVGLALGKSTVVVAGDDAGPQARVLAEQAGWPLLAEPTSGARTGDNAIRAYRLLLDGSLASEIERVVVFGHPTLSRPVSRLLGRADVELIVVSESPVWPDAAHNAALVTGAVTVGERDDPAWLARWIDADNATSKEIDELVRAEPGLTPYEIAAEVSRAVPPNGLLVVGSSNPVRDLDLMAAPYEVGGRRKVIANRGLSGIDGTVSTAVGAALGRSSSRALAVMGDVTFLHDANGLMIGRDDPRPDLTIIVINDNGGRIFATLEQGEPQHAASFERVFGTPHDADLGAVCAASRTPHQVVADHGELERALAAPASGIEVIEVRVDGSRRRDLDQGIRSLAGRHFPSATEH